MQVIVEIPYVFTQGLYYTLIVYSMMSFQWTVSKFFWFFFISFTSFLYFTYYGMMMVSITPNQHFAAIFASTFYSLFNLFSGFFIPKPVSFYNHIDCIFFPSTDHCLEQLQLIVLVPCVAENSQLVDLVLLGLSIVVDSLRANSNTIRRFRG